MMHVEEIYNSMMYTSFLLIAYTLSKTHVMNNLIIIEFIIVTILITMFTMLTSMKMENYLILYFIVTVICESMMGLSIMITLIRTHGNDYLQSLNIMKF